MATNNKKKHCVQNRCSAQNYSTKKIRAKPSKPKKNTMLLREYFQKCSILTLYVVMNMVVGIQAHMEGFIIGGSFVTIDKHPHAAFLIVTCVNNKKNYYKCGSSILNQVTVLTAAHCIDTCDSRTKISINMGSGMSEHTFNGTKRYASKFLTHKLYDGYTLEHDIGLVKMSQPVEYSSSISRVAIMSDPPYSELAVIAGWGLTNVQNKQKSQFLKQLHAKLLNHSECQRLIGLLSNGTFCARNDFTGNHVASGDSGSGLVVRGYIQIGLVSGTRTSIDPNIGVYTDVGYYYDWITSNVIDLYCDTENVTTE